MWPKLREKPNLREISVYRTPGEPRVHASERLAWILFDGKRPQDMPRSQTCPAKALERVLVRALPGWTGGMSVRWSAKFLLADCGNVADAAFLRGVYLYSAMLGKVAFPEGLRDMDDVQRLVASSAPSAPSAPAASSPSCPVAPSAPSGAAAGRDSAGRQPEPRGRSTGEASRAAKKLRAKSTAVAVACQRTLAHPAPRPAPPPAPRGRSWGKRSRADDGSRVANPAPSKKVAR